MIKNFSAKELRLNAILSVKPETEKIEELIKDASNKGELHIYIKSLSDAAKTWLKDNGFEIKFSIVPEHNEEFKITW